MNYLSKDFQKYIMFFALSFFALGLTSCSDDDDLDDIVDEPTGAITVQDQTLTQNILVVERVIVSHDTWLVVKTVNDDNTVDEMIADPVFLTAGTHEDVIVQLDNTNAPDVDLEDGDTLAVLLHADNGDAQFNENLDTPILDNAGNQVMEFVEISSPSITVADQNLVDNTITLENVNLQRDGWIVVHSADATGNINEDDIIARTFVTAGSHDNVVVELDEDHNLTSGSDFFVRLHTDDPADQEFTFETDTTTDVAETFGFNSTNNAVMARSRVL